MSRFGQTAIQGAQQSAQQGAQTGQQIAQTGAEATRATEARGQATSQSLAVAQQGASQAAQLKGQAGAAIGAGIADFGAAFERSVERRFQLNAKLKVMQEAANIETAKKSSYEAESRIDDLNLRLGALSAESDISMRGLSGKTLSRVDDLNRDRAALEQNLQGLLGTAEAPRELTRVAAARMLGQIGQFRKEQEAVLSAVGQSQKANGFDLIRRSENTKETLRQLSAGTTANLTRILPKIGDFFEGQNAVSDAEIINTLLGSINPFFSQAAERTLGVDADTRQENTADLVNRVNRGEISVGQIAAARDAIFKTLQPAGPDSLETLMRGASDVIKSRTRRALQRFDGVLRSLEINNKQTPGIEQRDMFAAVAQVGDNLGADLNDPQFDTQVMIAIGEATAIDSTTPSALLSQDPEIAGPVAETVFKMTGLGTGGEAEADTIKAIASVQKEMKVTSGDTFGLPPDQLPRRSPAPPTTREKLAGGASKILDFGFDFAGLSPGSFGEQTRQGIKLDRRLATRKTNRPQAKQVSTLLKEANEAGLIQGTAMTRLRIRALDGKLTPADHSRLRGLVQELQESRP